MFLAKIACKTAKRFLFIYFQLFLFSTPCLRFRRKDLFSFQNKRQKLGQRKPMDTKSKDEEQLAKDLESLVGTEYDYLLNETGC